MYDLPEALTPPPPSSQGKRTLIMTIQTHIETELENHGLWPNEAEIVIGKAKSDERLLPVVKRWEDETSGYPPVMIQAIWLYVRSIALDYLRQVSPSHFAIALLQEPTA